VIGETPYAEGNGDRSDLSLSAEDILTVINLRSFGIPTIVVLISGRPMILDNLMLYSDAIIAAWLPGTEGQGVVDVLFGDFVPTGKLSYTWPRSMSQIPINYGDIDYDPLFEYGFGLTFSRK
jgi:beta-glucosidase